MLRSVTGSLCVPRYSCVSPSFIISDAQGSLGISVFGLFGHFWTVFLMFWSQNTGAREARRTKVALGTMAEPPSLSSLMLLALPYIGEELSNLAAPRAAAVMPCLPPWYWCIWPFSPASSCLLITPRYSWACSYFFLVWPLLIHAILLSAEQVFL